MRISPHFGTAVLLSILVAACAQIKPPTGGEKDTVPPTVLNTIPENFSTDFNSSRIEIEFDEFVQLRNISSQLIINPAMDERPIFRLKGKRLIIHLESLLQEETTYVINFGDAIVDLTEGNPLSGFQYVFSTGSYLDSLQVQGEIVDAFDKKPVKGALVMIYSSYTDTSLTRGKPDYFTKTQSNGSFEINYIREGRYRLFAITDENSNYQYNPPSEKVAFLNSAITPGAPDSTNMVHNLLMFAEEDSAQYIDQRNETYYGQLQLVLYQPSDSVQVKPLNDDYHFTSEHGVVGDTITTWFTNRSEFPELDQIEVIVSAEPAFQDTIRWRMRRGNNDSDPEMVIKDNLLFNFNPYQPMRFAFNHPVERVDTSRIKLYHDSLPVDFQWESKSIRKFELHHPWIAGESYRIFIPDSTIFDVFQLTNDTLDKEVNMREERFFGNLQFELTFDEEEAIILQLLDERGNLVKEIVPNSSGPISYDKMLPGTYSMRVIYDLNENGKWDTGNLTEMRQPEPIEVYDQNIQIRSNWDMELQWDLQQE